MKNFLFKLFTVFVFLIYCSFTVTAQTNASQARAILDKAAKVIGRTGGVSASFKMSHPSAGTISGSIAVKGNRFNARTPQATVWFNGKTQWTYLKKNNEVNVSNPTAAQQQMMNPYTFLNIYKSGYNLATKVSGANNEVHLVANNSRQSIQEMYILVSRTTCVPSQIRMRHGGKWYTIKIYNFSKKNQPNNIFTFNAKDYPTAEIIDLR